MMNQRESKRSINQLEEKTTDCNAMIVFAHIDASKLIFDDGYKSSKTQYQGKMAMNKKPLEEAG